MCVWNETTSSVNSGLVGARSLIKILERIRKERNRKCKMSIRRKKTYNTRDSLVVTNPTTSLALLIFVYCS